MLPGSARDNYFAIVERQEPTMDQIMEQQPPQPADGQITVPAPCTVQEILSVIGPSRAVESLPTVATDYCSDPAMVASCMCSIGMTLDPLGRVEWVNEAFVHITGYSAGEVRGKRLDEFLYGPETSSESLSKLTQCVVGGTGICLDMLAYTKAGEKLWLATQLRPVHNQSGHLIRFISVQHDVTPDRTALRRMTHLANHDPLTGLPNRAMFNSRLELCIARAQRTPSYCYAVLAMDLDRFKVINDSLGHAAGDKLLTTVAERLTRSIRATDSIACGGQIDDAPSSAVLGRTGGDEFIVLLENIDGPSAAARVAERILMSLRRPVEVDGTEVVATTSIGVVVCHNDYANGKELLRDADIAMYRAKSLGRAQFVIFDRPMHESAVGRLQLENNLRHAIERDELLLHYQPVFSLSSRQVVGFEALIRWKRDDRLISPSEFIPIAEDTGLILPIGAWVMEQACRQLALWQSEDIEAPRISISINLSRRQLQDPELVSVIRNALTQANIDPALVTLEITESMVMNDMEQALAALNAIKDTGVRLSLDDFGTGYSSLSCLHKFPIDELKLDRSFILNLGDRRDAGEIIHSIITLAHKLNMRVVAEGLETPEQVAFLQALDCDFGQGYLFAQPLDAASAEVFLRGTYFHALSA